MYAILVAALLSQYNWADVPAKTYDWIGVTYVRKTIDLDDPLALVVYSDHNCTDCLRGLIEDTNTLGGFRVYHRDKSEIPDGWQDRELPLVQFKGKSGWLFASTPWSSAEDFRKTWVRWQSEEVRGENKSLPIRQSQAGSQGYYRAATSGWHLVSEPENRASLIRHLSTPSSEHHGAYFDRNWLGTLSLSELRGLHSDAHNNRVQWQWVGGYQSAPAKTVTKQKRVSAQWFTSKQNSDCPWCP